MLDTYKANQTIFTAIFWTDWEYTSIDDEDQCVKRHQGACKGHDTKIELFCSEENGASDFFLKNAVICCKKQNNG